MTKNRVEYDNLYDRFYDGERSLFCCCSALFSVKNHGSESVGLRRIARVFYEI